MIDDKKMIETYLEDLKKEIDNMPIDPVLKIIDLLRKARKEKTTVFTFGNGGSAALADIMANAFLKGVMRNSDLGGRPSVRFISLNSNMPIFSSWANDSAYEDVFSEQLLDLADEGDIAVGISTSGNSPNVLKGLKVAKDLGLTTCGLTGHEGGKMKPLCDICFVFPSDNVERIEEGHLIANHLLQWALRKG